MGDELFQEYLLVWAIRDDCIIERRDQSWRDDYWNRQRRERLLGEWLTEMTTKLAYTVQLLASH